MSMKPFVTSWKTLGGAQASRPDSTPGTTAEIDAGQDFADEIDARLEEANVILLLVSADFLASDQFFP
jgi:hypothetical protein